MLSSIRQRAGALDQSGDWPADDLHDLADAGAMRIAVPIEFGGTGASALEQHLAYETIARASLPLALILSQRDAAVGLIDAGDSMIRAELLPALAEGRTFATVGIAQLTTSRQGGAPAMRATRESDGYRIHGLIPWCTGAAKADWIVAGAATGDRRQLLFLLPSVPGDRPVPRRARPDSGTSICRGRAQLS